MELQLSTTLFFFFLSTTLLFLSSTTTGHLFQPISDDTDYIRSSCNSTRYPKTCFKSLSGYSGLVQHDSGRLARIAIHVALCNATHMSSYVSDISRGRVDSGNSTSSESAALKDCASVFGDAVDQIQHSLDEMRRLGWTGESVRFQLSNVQTWMSAALTNEETCTDGFGEVATDSVVKADVCDRVVAVKEVTSNALALVNRYADTITA